MTPPIHRRITLPPNPGSERHLELSLLGAFGLVDEAVPVVLTGASQRLIAFVALQGRAVTRTATAGALWPDVSDAQAHASLRSAIWRLEETAREALSVDVLDLDLAPHVLVDVRGAEALAHRLLLVDTMPSDEDITAEAILALSSELLPDWYDDWAILRAEDWRQLRLHALEALAVKVAEIGRYSDAIQAIRAAIRVDPLRESARSILIHIHLAEGNQSEALREMAAYRELLVRELGIEPTRQFDALLDPPSET